MKPLIVLISSFIFVLLFSRFFGAWNLILAGNAAMAAMLFFTAIGHFVFPKGMTMMMPDMIPYKELLVFLTGLAEAAAAIGLLIHSARHTTSLLLMLFFVIVLPANINAAVKRIDYQKADNSGKGADYLWFRIPLQVVFFLWVWYFGIIAE